MLIDEAYIIISAGKGGNGFVAFFPGKKSGPCGGDGGNGGNVYIKVNRNMTSLAQYAGKHKIEADDGGNGGSFNKTGENGEDLVLEFPLGTEFVETGTKKLIQLPSDDRLILVCQGGRGGFGNDHFKSSVNRTPKRAEIGHPGETRTFKVIMKLIADVGFIGLPNAGKSSLLNELTAASARVAPYPFTTLEPNLGSLDRIIIADIPGLIEGASSGKGLGIRFLKHIEKVKLLLHCVAADEDTKQMIKNYKTVRKELTAYSTTLATKKEIILLTKSDLVLPSERTAKLKSFKKLNSLVYCVSIYDLEALGKVTQIIKES